MHEICIPASASSKLIITAIAASSFPSDDAGCMGVSTAELPIIRMISESESKSESNENIHSNTEKICLP